MGLFSNVGYRIERELISWELAYHTALFSETGRTEPKLKRLKKIGELEARANRLISQYCSEVNPIPSDSNVLDIREDVYRKNLRGWLEQKTDGWMGMSSRK